MKITVRNDALHPIILNNMINEQWCFTKNGNYIHSFTGIDGNFYYNIIPYEKWPDWVWDLYEKEGITLDGPTPVEDIVMPKKPVDSLFSVIESSKIAP